MATRRSASCLYPRLLHNSSRASVTTAAAIFRSSDLLAPGHILRRQLSPYDHKFLANVDKFEWAAFVYAQKRWVSYAAAAKSEVSNSKISIGPDPKQLEKDDKENGVVYHGPISSIIKKVKLLSLSTCCLSVSLGPVMTFMTSPAMNVILKGAVASTVILLSASTTGALHWFASPYIHKLRWQPGSDSFEVEMLTWLATPVLRTIKFSDVRPPETNRPFVTFKADGKFYFVDVEHCHNKALLARLTPEKHPSESAFKNL